MEVPAFRQCTRIGRQGRRSWLSIHPALFTQRLSTRQFIASGQIKTLACYDVAPSLSITQMYKAADWYAKTQKFQRAVAAGGGKLEEKVDAFLKELTQPYQPVPSGASIDTEVGRQWQYEDVAEHEHFKKAV